MRVSDEAFKSSLPAERAQAMLENHQLLEDPGYFGGADLGGSLAMLEERPRTWTEFVAANRDNDKWA